MRVLVSGASMSGLSTAYWLRRYGHEVTLIEHARQLKQGGTAIDVRGAALGVAEQMNVLQTIRERKFRETSKRWLVDADGNVIFTRSMAYFNEHPDDVEIARDDLNEILLSVASPGVTLLFETAIQSMSDNGSTVDVTLNDGKRQTYDLVVGADGLHSNVRRLSFGSEHSYIRHLGLYVALVDFNDGVANTEARPVYNMPGRMAYVSNDGRRGVAMLLFRSPEIEYDYRDLESQRRIILEAFAGETGWRVPELMGAVKAANDFYFDSVSQIHMPSWVKGRTVLVGDAGYCASLLSGLGTSLAMLGAMHLAKSLDASPDDLPAAYEQYELAMRPYVTRAQESVTGNADILVPATREALDARNLAATTGAVK